MEENLYISEDGYLETFVVNETPEDVWFDDFMVMSTTSPIMQETHYDPLGLELTGIGFQYGGIKANKYLYQGKEIMDEQNLNIYDFHARGYDPVIGKTWQVDPMAESYYPWSPYSWAMNNPIKYMDPTGMFSTHTDEEGNVVAVFDDDDLGVYRHEGSVTKRDIESRHSKDNTTAGGEKMGETEYWDEFRALDNETGNVMESVMEGAKIMFGESWDPSIKELNNQAKGMNLLEIRDKSKKKGDFDIKENPDLAPFGDGTGKRLNGKYASARSAGNYLAGYNAAGGRIGKISLTRTGYLKLAGAYHSQGILTNGMVANIILNNASYGPAPYYGEVPYAGRMIVNGWSNKKWGR